VALVAQGAVRPLETTCYRSVRPCRAPGQPIPHFRGKLVFQVAETGSRRAFAQCDTSGWTLTGTGVLVASPRDRFGGEGTA